LNFTISTLAPSFGTTSGMRGAVAMNRSSSERWSADGARSRSASALPSRGKNAKVEAAPRKKSTAMTTASGVRTNTPIS